jgi:glycyl-tRNA synthetase beta chain
MRDVMDRTEDLLIEVGVEELPHSFIEAAMRDFRNLFTEGLKSERIVYGEVKEFSTPRRMALFIKEVRRKQSDYFEERRGPSVDKAYLPDGKPTKALLGFLKSNNISEKDTVTKTLDDKEYVFLSREIQGMNTIAFLPSVLDIALKSLSFPKTMKWEKSGFQFARPIRWILYLFGYDIVPFGIADVKSNNSTRGHRSYHNREIPISHPSEYERLLKGTGSVIADRSKRKSEIEKQIEGIISEKRLEIPVSAQALFDINTDLTEFPHSVFCEFDESFLKLPVEVLASEMIEHQNYFPLKKKSAKRLSRYFIAVSNIKENSKTVYGFQKVLRARLDDGRFFFNEDQKRNFAEYNNMLMTLTFHEKLGSMHKKIERIIKITENLATLLGLDKAAKNDVFKTAELCKNDLVTLMVNEFPNLQGVMGYYYACVSGFSEEVAQGIREHYLPRFATDVLPVGIEGSVVGIADRLDTILGIYSIGLKPKGSKDPFALRRKVFAIVKIIISLKMNFPMKKLLEEISFLYTVDKESLLNLGEVENFFRDRIKYIFEEMGFAYDEIDASLSNVLDDIYEAYRRVYALHEYRRNKDFADLLISFKRMWNIVRDEKKFSFSEELLIEKDEKELYKYFMSVREKVLKNVRIKNYNEVYKILATLKSNVDSYFDNVLVMDENLKLRENRIGMLRSIINVFSDIIDISKIVSL